jgi:hypothetical protein
VIGRARPPDAPRCLLDSGAHSFCRGSRAGCNHLEVAACSRTLSKCRLSPFSALQATRLPLQGFGSKILPVFWDQVFKKPADRNSYGDTNGYGNCHRHSYSNGNGNCDRIAAAYTDATASADTAASALALFRN